jgi:hypothetical protein
MPSQIETSPVNADIYPGGFMSACVVAQTEAPVNADIYPGGFMSACVVA